VEVIDHVVAFAKGQIASHCRLSLAWGCSATCDLSHSSHGASTLHR
jgi:hypothetical protein